MKKLCMPLYMNIFELWFVFAILFRELALLVGAEKYILSARQHNGSTNFHFLYSQLLKA